VRGIKAAVAAILEALDEPSAVQRLGAIQIGEDFAQERDLAAAFCQHALHTVEYCSLETFDVDLDQADPIEIDFALAHIIVEGDNFHGDIFREFARVVEEAGSKRTRPDTGIVIVETLRACSDDGHRGAAWPRAAGDLVGDDPITGIELGEPSDKGEILRHRLESL